MFQKLGEAINIWFSNIVLFTVITLTIWLPANILINLFYYSASSLDWLDAVKLSMAVEGLFGPIYIGAMIYALLQIKQNQRIGYKEAINVGLINWWNLFTARFIAGVLIILGLIALIIPGIILMIRYAVLDSAVIIESASASQARSRSVKLTKGSRWKIFGAIVLFNIVFIVISRIAYIPLGFVDHIALSIAVDCILDVISAILIIALFLFYWEARERESLVAES